MYGFESKLKSEHIDALFEAVLVLENREDCYRFFEDICTASELKLLAQRLQVAKMLVENKTHVSISEATGASTATISRVKRSLEYGAGGYKLVLNRLEEREPESG